MCGEYAVHYIRALQGPDPLHRKTIATAKHFSDYDQEGSADESSPTSRMNFVANVTARDQVAYFWPPFRAAVQGAQVSCMFFFFLNCGEPPP